MISRHPTGIHGYALKRQCDRILGHFWHFTLSEVYRVLGDLQGEGLLEVVENGSVPNRKLVRVTDEGRSSLGAFLVEAPTDLAPPRRQELAVKMLFAQSERLPDLVRAIDRQRNSCMEELHLLSAQRRKLRRGPVDPFIASLLIDGVEGLVRAQIGWLDDVSKKLQERLGAPT